MPVRAAEINRSAIMVGRLANQGSPPICRDVINWRGCCRSGHQSNNVNEILAGHVNNILFLVRFEAQMSTQPPEVLEQHRHWDQIS